MIKCNFCNAEFKNRRGIALHLSTKENKNFSSDLNREEYLVNMLFGAENVKKVLSKYINEEICFNDIRVSDIDICKYVELLGIKRTHAEEKKTKRYTEKVKNTLLERYGVDNVSQIPGMVEKVKQTNIKKYGTYENYLAEKCSELHEGYKKFKNSEKFNETQEKIKQTNLERYGHENFGSGARAKEKSIETRKELYKEMTLDEKRNITSKARKSIKHRGGGGSKIELRVRKALDAIGIDYKCNQSMWDYNYDMVFDNIIIEVQGDLWHANPNKYKADDFIMKTKKVSEIWEKDKRKKEIAENNNYILIPIWECDIKPKSDEQLITFIKELIWKK